MASILLYSFYSVCAVLASVFVILYYHCKFKQNFWKKLNIKYFQSVPVFGNVTKSMFHLESFQETYQQMYEAIGDDPYAGYYEMNSPMLMVKDPKLVSTIIVNDFKHFPNRARPLIFIKNRKLNQLSLHLGSATDEHWKFLRQAVSPIFTAGKIKQMHGKLAESINVLESYLHRQMNGQNSVDVELKHLFERLTMHVITSTAFGANFTSVSADDEFCRMMNLTFQPKLKKTWHKLLAEYCPSWLNDLLNRAEVSDEVLDYFRGLVLDSVEYRRLHGIQGDDILQVLMNLQNSHVDSKFTVCDGNKTLLPHEKFDEIDIMANIYILLFGGFDTTSAAMSFCIYELALNEDIQQHVRVEVQNVRNKFGNLNYDSLKEMSFLDAVIAETIRKYPVTVSGSRVCSWDYIIPGTEIRLPKGTIIKIPTWSLHHDSRYYPNPEKFDPQRFLGNNKSSIQNGTYLPFGDGPRSCVGRRFAEVELKAAIADMILKYEIKPCMKTEIPIKFKKGSNMLLTENGIWVNMTRRKT